MFPQFAKQTGDILCKAQSICYNKSMQERLLPIGIQDFEELRKRNCIYVDKTNLIYTLAKEGKTYFLSRPRRFGKSLLLSTMEYYFLGRKDLFSGLKIEDKEKDWTCYPILKITFGVGSYDTNERLKERLNVILSEFEEKFKIKKTFNDFGERLNFIIKSVYEKTGKQVVILIDEYDKPVLDALYSESEEKNRAELRNFYSPLKDADKYIHFLFITGITKVSHMNIFSGLNQLNDISLNANFSSICGIAEAELDEYFSLEIEKLANNQEISVQEAKEKLKAMYDGYHFSHNVQGVYNPFCLLKCFWEKDFGSYWFESGTPSFLVKTLQNQPLYLMSLINGRKANENEFKNYDPESKNMLPVVYQSGYLTIKDFEKEDRLYTLDFPNREVESGFLDVLLKKFVSFPDDDLGLEITNLRLALRNAEIDKILSILKAAIADLPTIVKKEMCENYYESVIHLIFRLSGYRLVSELQSVCGRSDVVVVAKDNVYIFELKMDKGRPTEEVCNEALSQIDENGYADRFAISGKKMFKVGIVLSSSGKGLVDWKAK